MKLARATLAVVCLLLIGVTSDSATTRKVLLRVDQAPLAWGDCRIADQLTQQLTRSGSIEVKRISDDYRPSFPNDSYNLDSLVNWGLESGGRYLLLVDVHREGLERRKDWVLPLIFHRWVTVGVIEGELRLIDLNRARSLVAEPFRVERKAKGAFQASIDDNANDPDIHLSAPEKVRFFAMLEQALCDQITTHVDRYAHNGGR